MIIEQFEQLRPYNIISLYGHKHHIIQIEFSGINVHRVRTIADRDWPAYEKCHRYLTTPSGPMLESEIEHIEAPPVVEIELDFSGFNYEKTEAAHRTLANMEFVSDGA